MRRHPIRILVARNHPKASRWPSLSKTAIRKLARLCASKTWPTDAQIEIVFLDNRRIELLNRRHLRRSGPTDVITFTLEEAAPPDEEPTMGSLAISAQMAREEAAKRGVSARDELALYVAHGLLHLAGYHDATSAQRRAMYKREREVLSAAGFTYVR